MRGLYFHYLVKLEESEKCSEENKGQFTKYESSVKFSEKNICGHWLLEEGHTFTQVGCGGKPYFVILRPIENVDEE